MNILPDQMKSITIFLLISLNFQHLTATPNTCSKILELGIAAEESASLMRKKADFFEKAAKVNPRVRTLSSEDLRLLRKEFRIVGFTGYSRAFKLETPEGRTELEIYKMELAGLLGGLDPHKVIISSGATNTGVAGLIYEVAAKMGFRTMGITALASTKYEPASMNFLYIEDGKEFGDESRVFIRSIDYLVALGGGKQALREMALSQDPSIKLPLFAIKNERIDGASTTAPFVDSIVSNGSMAAAGIRALMGDSDLESTKPQSIIRKVNVLPIEQLSYIYEDKTLIAFTGWSKNVPQSADGVEKFRQFVNAFLQKLDTNKHLLVTSGSDLGAEAIVHSLATKKDRPFRVVALTADSIKTDELFSKVESVFSVSKTWSGRVFNFLNHVDVLVSGGGGDVIAQQINAAAKGRGIPWVHVPEIFIVTDLLVPPEGQIGDGAQAAEMILKKLSP